MNLEPELREVCEDVYAYLQPDGSWYLNNTGFLVNETGVISVDATSTERRTRAYLDAIATVTEKPVRTLVNTHHHGDHTHGNYLMSGATIVGHERCREAMLASPMPPPAPVTSTTLSISMLGISCSLSLYGSSFGARGLGRNSRALSTVSSANGIRPITSGMAT